MSARNYIACFLFAFLASLHAAELPNADSVTRIRIQPAGARWFITINLDGSVSADLGSHFSPHYQMQMVPGTIDFPRLRALLLRSVASEPLSCGSKVWFSTANESLVIPNNLRDDTLLRYLFPNDRTAWKRVMPRLTKDLKPDGLEISEISAETASLLERFPIYP
jgi:hypothetical protein